MNSRANFSELPFFSGPHSDSSGDHSRSSRSKQDDDSSTTTHGAQISDFTEILYVNYPPQFQAEKSHENKEVRINKSSLNLLSFKLSKEMVNFYILIYLVFQSMA